MRDQSENGPEIQQVGAHVFTKVTLLGAILTDTCQSENVTNDS